MRTEDLRVQALKNPLGINENPVFSWQLVSDKKDEKNESELEFDWVSMYAAARSILGWSDEEFFAATPRKYYAHYFAYCKMHNILSEKPALNPLVGKEAIKCLSQIAGKIR